MEQQNKNILLFVIIAIFFVGGAVTIILLLSDGQQSFLTGSSVKTLANVEIDNVTEPYLYVSSSNVLRLNETRLVAPLYEAIGKFAEIDPFWNGNLSIYNSSWSNMTNTSYYLFSNPYGYYNITTLPPAGAETDPYWTDNFTKYNASWSNMTNTSYLLVTQWNATNTSYYLESNPYNYYNSTTLPLGTETDPYWTANFSSYNSSWTSTYNSTYDVYNSTGLIKDWNSSGLIINWTGADLNATGLIKDWNATGYLINWSNVISIVETLWNANYSTFLTHITWANAMNGTLFKQTDWDANYSANNDAWLNTTNLTYDAYNSSGLIKDWNATGLIKNWSIADLNATGLVKDWNDTGLIKDWNSSGYLINWSTSFSETLWNANYSTFLTHITWANAMNGTLAKYTDLATNNLHTHNAENITAGTFGAGNFSFNGNVSMGTNYTCYGSACNSYIYYNGSSMIIKVT